MRRPAWPSIRPLNVAQQLAGLTGLYPTGSGRLEPGRLLWEGSLRPSPFSREYLVRIDYRQGYFPRTRVIEPTLRSLAGNRKIPHIYREPDDPLCLFWAPAKEWNCSRSIARTIVPWTSEWLFHFEAWLFTGEWDGGGIGHHSGDPGPLPERPVTRND